MENQKKTLLVHGPNSATIAIPTSLPGPGFSPGQMDRPKIAEKVYYYYVFRNLEFEKLLITGDDLRSTVPIRRADGFRLNPRLAGCPSFSVSSISFRYDATTGWLLQIQIPASRFPAQLKK